MTKTLKELQEEHPEWCWKCGRDHQSDGHYLVCRDRPILAALIAAKREDEARIAEQDTELDRVKVEVLYLVGNHRHRCGRHEELSTLISICAGAKGEIGEDNDYLASQLTAEQQAHAETKRQLEEVDQVLTLTRDHLNDWIDIEDYLSGPLADRINGACQAALGRQASINRPTDNSPTDDRGEGGGSDD